MDKRSDKRSSRGLKRDEYDDMRAHHFVKATKAVDKRKRDRQIDSILRSKNPRQYLNALEEEF